MPALKQAAPGAKLIEVSAATPSEIAAADATIGVCSAEVLRQAKQLQWIQWPAAGVDRCVQQPVLHERHLLLTNLQRTMGPSMAEHVLGLMLALSRHCEYFMKRAAAGPLGATRTQRRSSRTSMARPCWWWASGGSARRSRAALTRSACA